ncbi:MAG: NifU family protein [Flavobacteriales bacterium]
MNTELEAKVEKALEEIRPYLLSDGGDISLVEITEDKTVRVKLHGSCVDCNVNQMTLKMGVEATIKRIAPEILAVEKL